MKKIVIDARTMGSRPSGIGMYLHDFLKELIKCEDFEITLLSDVATSEYIKYFMDRGIEVRTMGEEIYESIGVFSYFKFIQRQLDELRPDIFWEVNAIIPVKLKNAGKIVVTIHDMFPITHRKYLGMKYSLYFKHSMKKTLRYVDLILYNSEETKKTTERIFQLSKWLRNKVGYIIVNPLTELPTTKDEGYFLYVGNMEKRKGVDLLLKGYREYKRCGGHRKLVIAGKMQEEDIQKLLDKTIKEIDGIEYLDYVSNEKKRELFANCGCFLFPSKAEGFGIPVIEAMNYYKPIIVSGLNIFDEVIGDCVNKFYLEGTESEQVRKLAQLMYQFSDNVDREAYKEVIERYTPEKLGGSLIEAFKEL